MIQRLEWILSDIGDITFECDAAVNSVDMDFTGPAKFFDSNGVSNFVAGDQVTIQQISIILPMSFCQGDMNVPYQFKLEWETNSSSGVIDQFGNNGTGQFPKPDIYNFLLGIELADNDDRLTDLWELQIGNFKGTVSMVNLPGALDGEILPAQVGLLVAHNEDML